MSRSLIIWRTRFNEAEVAIRIWAPRLEEVLSHAGDLISGHYSHTHDAFLTQQSVGPLMTNPLTHVLELLYFDVSTRFIRRRGELVKGSTDDPRNLPDLELWIRQAIASKVTLINKTTRLRLRRLLTQAQDEGWSIARTVREIRNSYGFSRARAMAIARTELIGSANAATHFSMRLDHDIDTMTKSWLNAGDARVRPTHNDVDSSTRIPYAEPFIVGGAKLLFPGDTSLGAPAKELVNCRCAVLYFPG